MNFLKSPKLNFLKSRKIQVVLFILTIFILAMIIPTSSNKINDIYNNNILKTISKDSYDEKLKSYKEDYILIKKMYKEVKKEKFVYHQPKMQEMGLGDIDHIPMGDIRGIYCFNEDYKLKGEYGIQIFHKGDCVNKYEHYKLIGDNLIFFINANNSIERITEKELEKMKYFLIYNNDMKEDYLKNIKILDKYYSTKDKYINSEVNNIITEIKSKFGSKEGGYINWGKMKFYLVFGFVILMIMFGMGSESSDDNVSKNVKKQDKDTEHNSEHNKNNSKVNYFYELPDEENAYRHSVGSIKNLEITSKLKYSGKILKVYERDGWGKDTYVGSWLNGNQIK